MQDGKTRSRTQRAIGYVFATFGVLELVAVLVYAATHLIALLDVAIAIFVTFGLVVGLSLLSLGINLAASSALFQRLGCVASIVFGTPTLLIFIFLVVSLFQTTRAATGP